MPRKYLAFDIETYKIIPNLVGELLAHRPLGISCIGALCADESNPRLFYSKGGDGRPTGPMQKQDVAAFINFLLEQTTAGYTLLSFNGLGFDFDVLAEESGRLDDCRQLAFDHVDVMFHVFCTQGYPVGLGAAAQAIGQAKSQDVDGELAPQMWQDGQRQKVLDYVAQDCKVTLNVASQAESKHRFSWVTKKGGTSGFALPRGWLTVREAMALPLPDTGWMDKPLQRSRFTQWLG
jgi:RNase_H superfamily